jgi:hypothetical protein
VLAGGLLVGLVVGLTALGVPSSLTPVIGIGAFFAYLGFVSRRWPAPATPGQVRFRELPRGKKIAAFWFIGTMVAMGAVVILQDLLELTPSIWLVRVIVASGIAASVLLCIENWVRAPDGSRPSVHQTRFRAYPRSRQIAGVWWSASLLAIPTSFVVLTLIGVTAPIWVLWLLVANAVVASLVLLAVRRFVDPETPLGHEPASPDA